MRKISFIVLMLITLRLSAECDMMAMIAKNGYYLSSIGSSQTAFSSPEHFFDFVADHSTNYSNNDGYGIIYYPEDGTFHNKNGVTYHFPNNGINEINRSFQSWYLVGFNSYYSHNNESQKFPLDNARATILHSDSKAKIVLGHARNASGSYGSHPFTLRWNNKTYSLMHNGVCGYSMQLSFIDYLGEDWEYKSNWTEQSYHYWIDSELLFHYLMKNIIEADGNVLQGIFNALNRNYEIWNGLKNQNYMNSTNFVLSDGENLYAFRNAGGAGSYYRMFYRDLGGFYGIKTQGLPEGWDPEDEVAIGNLLVFSPGGHTVIEKMLNDHYSETGHIFLQGDLSEDIDIYNLAHDNDINRYWIVNKSSIPINSTLFLQRDTTLNFARKATLTIFGELILESNTHLALNHGSEIIVTGNNGKLTLGNGSRLSGITAETQYQADPYSYIPYGVSIKGDRVSVRNGALFRTPSYTPHSNPITIFSRGDHYWDGIFIETPSPAALYRLHNINISGIQNFAMKGSKGYTPEAEFPTLSFTGTNFNSNGKISVRDNVRLALDFSSLTNTPLELTNTSFFIDNSTVTESERAGIFIRDGIGQNNTISNTTINYNNGDGVHLINTPVSIFRGNEIYANFLNGITALKGTKFGPGSFSFNNIELIDNRMLQFLGVQDAFSMGSNNSNIVIRNDANERELLLYNLGDDYPVDLRGTNLTLAHLHRLVPNDESAWIFNHSPNNGFAGISPERVEIADLIETLVKNMDQGKTIINDELKNRYSNLFGIELKKASEPEQRDSYLLYQRIMKDIYSQLIKHSYYVEQESDKITNEMRTKVSNYPNPFNTHTNIKFNLDSAMRVSVAIYNIKGDKVLTLKNSVFDEGEHSLLWNGKNENGKELASGIYLYKITGENFITAKQMLMLK